MDSNLLIISEERLKFILAEAICNALDKYRDQPSNAQQDKELFGDLDWLYTVYPSSISKATIKHKSATGQIPGKIKVQKRVMYDKAVVIDWLKSNASLKNQPSLLKQKTDQQFDNQHNRILSRKNRIL